MIKMHGNNDFNGRYDFFKWSAPIYETPEEVVKVMNDLPLKGKTVKEISVIGAVWNIGRQDSDSINKRLYELGYDMHKFREEGYKYIDKALMPCEAEIFEPIQFIFTDGTTFEFLPMSYGGARFAMNSIPVGLTDGLNKSNFRSGRFYKKLNGANFKGFALETIKEERSNLHYWHIATNYQPMQEIRTFYRYQFDFDGEFDLEIQYRYGNYVLRMMRYSDIAKITYSQLKKTEKAVVQIEIEYIDGHMCFSAFNSRKRDYDYSCPRQRYNNWRTAIDDVYAGEFLQEHLYRHYDPTIQGREDYENKDFDWYGHNHYTYESMKHMIADLYRTADLLETDFDAEELTEIKKHYRASTFGDIDYKCDSKEKERTFIKENIGIATDFYRRFAERLETMMRECDDCDMVAVSGP